MRILRGTLTFVLGMIIGIILFVIAIGGAVMLIGTSVTVGELQGNFTEEDIISPGSQLYNQTILEAVQSIMSDVQALDSLTMRTLYEHYGIELLNGISGIDFTEKDFYDTDFKSLIDDLSIVVNSFTLEDISELAGVDFREYELPVLTDNLGNNIETALDNILSSLNGDLSIRSINANFGIDLGVDDNALIKTLQDVALSAFGEVINAITLDTLLEVDSNLFVQKGANRIYQVADTYEKVNKFDLQKKDLTPGVETYYAGATKNADGSWSMIENELRYVEKELEDGSIKYVVDNSCYAEDFDANTTDKTFYRHIQYIQADGTVTDLNKLYVETYYNRIATFDNDTVTLKSAGFSALSDLNNIDYKSLSVNPNGTISFSANDADLYFVLDKTITKDSLLRKYDEEDKNITKRNQSFVCVHTGESEQLLQIIAPMTVSELQKADDLLNSLTVGDVVDTDAKDTALVLVSLKDCKLTEIGSKVNELPLDQVIEIDDESAPIMKALKAHNCTLNNIGNEINKFAIGEIMEIDGDIYGQVDDGDYVKEEIVVKYNKYVHPNNSKLYFYEGGKLEEVVMWSVVPDDATIYTKIEKYRLYNEETDKGKERWSLLTPGTTALAIQMMAKRGYTLNDIGNSIDDMGFDELIRIKSTDSQMLKTLSKKGATLDNINTIIDDLKIDEVIEINENSAIIMQSLKEKECKINDLGNVAKTLTLRETTEIDMNTYKTDLSGKYVYIPSLNDTSDKKLGYYTLYNPAEHINYDRYSIEKEGTSSRVLQRLANSTVDGLSSAFDSLILGDVLDIDIDILARDEQHQPGVSYFYYDRDNSLYMRQDETYKGEEGNYHIAHEGENSSSVLKRLAYVQIDKLSDAMEKVMKDMMLSELVDIYSESAVSISKNTDAISENDMFIVKPFGYEYDESGNKTSAYTFVLNKESGRYIKRDYGFYALSSTDESLKTGTKTYFKWSQISNATEFATAVAAKNIYYYDAGNNEYVYNPSLCAYVGGKELAKLTANRDFSKLYTRISCTENETGAIGMDTYSDTKLYVLLNGAYTPYDSSNVLHLDLPLYEKRDGTCYVETTTPGATDDAGYKYLGADSKTHESLEPLYSKQYCEDIYVQVDKTQTDDVYVFIDNKYEPYISGVHDEDVQRYKKVEGYLASASECYFADANGTYTDSIGDAYITRVDVERQKSEKVLQTLANATIGGINNKIKDAKIGDLLEIESGSLFEEFEDTKLADISSEMQKALKNWTIGDLAKKANITSIDPEVKSALENVTLNNFFNSLTFSSTAGIVVDLEKAYGYNN